MPHLYGAEMARPISSKGPNTGDLTQRFVWEKFTSEIDLIDFMRSDI